MEPLKVKLVIKKFEKEVYVNGEHVADITGYGREHYRGEIISPTYRIVMKDGRRYSLNASYWSDVRKLLTEHMTCIYNGMYTPDKA